MSETISPTDHHGANGRSHTSMPATRDSQPAAAKEGSDRVLAAFQETMRTFLEVQRSTMLAYLSGRPQEPQPSPPVPKSRAPHGVEQPSPRPPSPPSPRPISEAATPAPVVVATNGKATGPARPNREAIATELLRIVRDRTGYPLEVLKLELDIEADLGIDSIKRVEILGKLRDTLPGLGDGSPSNAMEQLSRAKTLGDIVDRAERIVGQPLSQKASAQDAPAARAPAHVAEASPPQGLRRLLLQAVDAPLQGEQASLTPGGVVLVTDDGRGVATAVAQGLEARGFVAQLVGGPDSRLDWSSADAVEKEVRRARRLGPITGLIHALPLRSARDPGFERDAWADRMASEVRGLFLLAKGLTHDLEVAAEREGACLIAASGMGGTFASVGGAPAGVFAGQGAVSGIVKTLAREWPNVRVRAVDLEPRQEPRQAAHHLVAEALSEDGWAEVGYQNGRRVRLNASAAPLADQSGNFVLSEGEPVVITGGARGITALTAIEMARRWRPTLLLIGTTPPPTTDEWEWLNGTTAVSEVKSKLYERLIRTGVTVAPAELERAYQSLRRSREVSENLDRMRALGARVEYARADVRDPNDLARVLEAWRRRFGDPVGLIHGAGFIKDKLICAKSVDVFDRVLGTKLEGALNLARSVKADALRFAVFFSSIAGRFGNAGQSDYAAANEAMNKLAVQLDRQWSCRVVAPIWGPWAGIGMVSELEGHLGAQGLGTIAPEDGVAALMDELSRGRKGEVEVVLARELGTLDAPIRRVRRLEEARA